MNFLYEPGRIFSKGMEVIRGSIARAQWALGSAPKQFDAVVIHREALLLGVDWIERTLARRLPTIYDFDDAVWLPNVSKANRTFRLLKGFAKVDRLLATCSAVSAGCEYLAQHARRFNPAVLVVPTSIDLDHYGPPRTHGLVTKLTVGWTGSVTTQRYLEILGNVLLKASRVVPLRLVVLGARLELEGLDVTSVPWSPENELEVIRTFDVGLKPSAREEWALGKCPMKDIQYMALGIPPIATRFGTALESIDHGRSGFLCDSENDWIDALRSLQDVELRKRMGAEARRVVEQRYSSETAAAAFSRVVDEGRRRFRES